MKTIWKLVLETTDTQTVFIPRNSELLCVQLQYDIPCLWYRCDPNEELVSVTINTYGTGHPIEKATDKYIDTYQLSNGTLVFHVFAELS
jgi:hypothetical protein